MTGLAAVAIPGAERLDGQIVAVLVAGIVAGLVLLARGFAGYRAAGRMGGIAPSRVASLAVGEVLVTGAAEPIELTLVSPLQSAACVYYRSRVVDRGEGGGTVFHEERAVGFRVRDETGAIRVFPFGARFDVPDRYDEQAGMFDAFPIGLVPRTGSAFGPGPDRDAQIAALLTVHGSAGSGGSAVDDSLWLIGGAAPLVGGASALAGESHQRHYTEARIEAGDVVTVVGRALPFGDIADPAMANLLDIGLPSADDPEIAADLDAARAAGTLVDSATAAWGNAGIEGFGIGRPVRPATLDPRANPLPAGDARLAARARDAFEIAPEALVMATAPDASLLVSLGAAGTIVAREQGQFFVGLLGAVLAIGSAVALAVLVAGVAT